MKNTLILLLFVLVAAAVYYTISKDDSGSLAQKPLTDFAIADTAGIGKIIIGDGIGEVVLKRGEGRFWSLNDTLTAMPHHIDVLMQTFIDVGIQNPVPLAQRETVMKIIIGDTRKVQVYDRAGEWIKTWYVGRPTQSSLGTYAILETPEDGRSSEPFIIEKRSFKGYLTSRFHANVHDWRWTGVFNYPKLDFKSVKVETPRDPKQGYAIQVKSQVSHDFQVYDSEGQLVEPPKASVAAFLGAFKQLNVEHFKSRLRPHEEDSLLSSPPAFIITVTGHDDQEEIAEIWYRKTPEVTAARSGANPPVIDPERVFVRHDGYLSLAQRENFDAILRSIYDF